MTDLEAAKTHLEGHSICLCRGSEVITDDGRGISPMMRLIAEGKDLRGFSAADVIVGKAAAMLFVKAGVVSVHGNIMSESGRAYLTAHGIPCTCGTLTERIINRQGTGVCPMEQTVAALSDPEEGYAALCRRLAEMKQNHA
ncbi:MAG: DUF1893 domain-containing protein [Oscillospiraceae bacterium]|nr:DUF1893 domain-containing protein [Oscillospiraceae bacterium]